MVNNKKRDGSSTKINNKTMKVLVSKLKNSVLKEQRKNNDLSLCWKSKLKPNGRGHVQIKMKGIKYLGHRIMACAREKPYVYVEYSKDIKNDASHLCWNNWCINPYHIWIENTLINQSRDCCKIFYEENGYMCPHSPPCVLNVNY